MAKDEKKPVVKVNQGGSKVKASKMNYNNEKRDLNNKKERAERHKKTLAWQAKRTAKNKSEGYVLPSYTKRLRKREEKRKGAKAKKEKEVVTTPA